jgi:hypothetical protein
VLHDVGAAETLAAWRPAVPLAQRGGMMLMPPSRGCRLD